MRPIKVQYAKGRSRHKPGEMNSTEEAYANYLDGLMHKGEIEWFLFESIKFKLAAKTFYTPDFVVMRSDYTIEVHEVKGKWEDDARVKIKIAAQNFPFKFIAARPKAKKDGGGWAIEEF